jgi:putative ABC transport system substrate-binding protein
VIDRRVGGAAIVLLSASPCAWSQRAGKVWRIGVIGMRPPNNREHAAANEAFMQLLRERGYVEGNNLLFEKRYTGGKVDRSSAFAAELVALNVDLIVVSAGSTAVRAGMEVTKTIPIVMIGATNPVEFGLVDSLARPGANVTGVADLSLDLLGKRLQLLKTAAPTIERVVYIGGPATAFTTMNDEAIGAAGKALGIQVRRVQISASQSFDEVAAAIAGERPDAVLLGHHVSIGARDKEIAQFAIKHRLPTVAALRDYVHAGILMSYGHTSVEVARSAAVYVEKILRGAKPSELAVEQPAKFELVINRKTAKAIGLTVPQSLLLRADKVIE